MKKSVIAVLVVSVLSGCISFLPEPEAPDGFYRFSEVLTGETLSVDHTVLVRRPEAPKHLAGSDIVAKDDRGTLTVIRRASWADNMPRLLQMSVLDFVNSEGRGSALLPQTGTRPDFELVWRISSFQLEGRRAVVQGELTLLDGTTRNPVRQKTLRSVQDATGDSVSARVQALRTAGKDFAGQAAHFLAQSMDTEGAPGAD